MGMGEWMSIWRVAIDRLIVMTPKIYLKYCQKSNMEHLVNCGCKMLNLRCLIRLPLNTHLFSVSRTFLKNNCPVTSCINHT